MTLERDAASASRDREAFVPLARELGVKISPHSAAHDRDGSFVTEAFDALRDAGYLERGKRVLSMSIPVHAEGVEILDTWDTLGMRGTGSNDAQLSDVFVSDAQVGADRPWGVLDSPLMVIACNAMPVITGAYLGVAQAARDHAVAAVASSPKGDDPLVQRQVGLIDTKLRVARWSLLGAIDEIGDDPEPAMERVVAAMAAKRCVAEEGVAICDLAMEVVGGSAFYKRNPIEQCYRDIRAAKFHPLTPELSLLHAGRVALGRPADEM